MAEELKILKQQRKTMRNLVTKLITSSENNLKEEDILVDVLEIQLSQLKEKADNLKDLDKDIVKLLKLDDIDGEIVAAQEYYDKITACKFRLSKKIKELNNKEMSQTGLNIDTDSNENNSTGNRESKQQIKTVKLPKLAISKFFGDPSNWLEFYNQFESAIHNNESLSKIDKFNYLKTLLGGIAANAVSGFSLTNDNYDSAIQLLKDRFGRKDMLINSYVCALLNIPPLKNSSDVIGLRKLYDKAEIQTRNLQALGVTTEMYGSLLCPILLKIVPPDLALEFNRSRDSDKNWELEELMNFLRKELESRERAATVNRTETKKYFEGKNEFDRHRNSPKKNYSKSVPSASALTAAVKEYCIFCKNNSHNSDSCQETSIENKRDKLKRENRCYRCFRRSHVVSQCIAKIKPCSSCFSTKHNSIICNFKPPPKEELPSTIRVESTPIQTESTSVSQNSVQNLKGRNSTLLQICSIKAISKGKSKLIKCLLDCGSEKSFVTQELAEKLEFKFLRKECLLIYSFGNRNAIEKYYSVVQVKCQNARDPLRFIVIEALVTDVITGALLSTPSHNINKFLKEKNLELADSGLCDSSKIDLLIGSDYYWEINLGKIEQIDKTLFASETIFGWTVQGRISKPGRVEKKNKMVMKIVVEESLNNDFRRLWELDSLGIDERENNLKVDTQVMNDFEKQLEYVNGRYKTKLLWDGDCKDLNDNFGIAKRRFNYLLGKFKSNSWLLENYCEVIRDYLEKGIVEEPPKMIDTECLSAKSYYMPHRAVIRDDKSTSKLRIVFDASSSKQDALSLNDHLLAGPNLNPNILSVILKFRSYEVGFSADVEKAFLQILIDESDRNFLRFIWLSDKRDLNENNWQILRMTRVPFGITSSPFILAATIKHHIKKYKSQNEEAYEMLNNSLYVDDLFYGAATVEESLSLSKEAVRIMSDAGMHLRKWKTNSISLKNKWEREGISLDVEDDSMPIKVLGIVWNLKNDSMKLEDSFVSEVLRENLKPTKRSVLKIAAKIFDPVGFISAYVIRVKCLLQEIWQKGLDWDEELTEELKQKWNSWYSEIGDLQKLTIDRRYFFYRSNNSSVQVHTFCDATPHAYGAVCYFRYKKEDDTFATTFITSKAKVAPLKKLTLPRLELMSAVIASRIANYLKDLFKLNDSNLFYWSDSTITLHWIRGTAAKWKPFISNRVTEIQSISDPLNWKHCSSQENPADILSRGSSAEKLSKNSKWWHGPSWLCQSQEKWPVTAKIADDEALSLEMRKWKPEIVVCHSSGNCKEGLNQILKLENYSSLIKVYRITAWMKRFIANSRIKTKEERNYSELTAQEILEVEKLWVRNVQEESFPEEMKSLSKDKQIPKESKIFQLNPFLSDDGLLLVKGRLQKTKLEFYTKHPILIPSKHKFTELLIRDAHGKVYHAGLSDTLVQIREKFWILKGRQAIKSVLKNCVVCKRFNVSHGNQVMAPLPADRIEESPPFSVVGIDFGGPLYVKNSDDKYYILLCTCAVTRAIHLELVSNLTTETFILAFRRFIARRGLCNTIYSDNSKTFKRAELELKNMWEIINHPQVREFYAKHGIKWNYIVERGAWWGGFYERLIRSVKLALRKTLGKSSLTRDQLETVLIEIEGVINCRPITYIYSDIQEPSPLTPSHFIVGKRLLALPAVKLICEGHFSNRKLLVKVFNYRERLMQLFWKRWTKEYLLGLRSAHSITSKDKVSEFKVNDIVLVHDDYLPRNFWKLGKILETYPGRDGKVRSCSIKTETATIRRPVQLLYNLELQE